MFKKLSVVLLCFAFLFGVFAGCDQDSPDPKPSDKKEITVQIDGESEGRLERVYDGEPQTVTASSTPAKTLKIEYEGKDGTQYEKTQTAPTDAGSYAVTVSFAGDSEYKAYSKTVQLNVAKADPIIDAEGSSAGKISAGYTGSPVAVEPVVIPDDIEVTIEYKDKDAEDEEYTQTAPTDVGVYTVKISFDGNVNFSAAEELFELEITQGEVVLSLEGLVSGAVRKDYTGEPVAVEPIVTPSEKTVSVEYKAKGESDSEYTSQAPAAVGEYDVRLLFAGDKNYKAKTEVFTLVISYKAAEIPAGAETISDFSDNKFQVFEKDDPRGGDGATIADHWTMENGEFVYDNTAGGAIDLRDGEVAFTDWFTLGSILPADHNYTTLYVAVRVEGEGTLDIQLDTYHKDESSFKYAVNDVAAAETEGWKIVEVPIAPENHISESQREIDTKIVRIIASEGISAVHLDWIAAKQTKVRISLVGEADGVVTVPFTGNAIAVTPVTSPADKPVMVEYKPQGAEDAQYSEQAPSEVGVYDVKVSFAGDTDFPAAEALFTLNIISISVPEGYELISDFKDEKMNYYYDGMDPAIVSGSPKGQASMDSNGVITFDYSKGQYLDLRKWNKNILGAWNDGFIPAPDNHDYTTLKVAVKAEGAGELEFRLDCWMYNEAATVRYEKRQAITAEESGQWVIVDIDISEEGILESCTESRTDTPVRIMRIYATGITQLSVAWIAVA